MVEASLEIPECFPQLFDRHFESIHSYLSRRVGGQLADDLASEVFVQAFKSRARFDVTTSNARPWLYGIASRLLSHHYRAERRRLLAYARAASQEVVPDVTEDIDARTDAAGTASRLADGLADLATGDRDALLLLAWGDLAYDEIAQALDIPIGTVRSRIHRARRVMRELIEQTGQHPHVIDLIPRAEGETHHG